MTATRHFLLAAGGTGGHMLPAYALAGELIARGMPAASVEEEIGQVVEGVATVQALMARAREAGVELPISEQVEAAVFEGRSPEECLRSLMSRAPANEA